MPQAKKQDTKEGCKKRTHTPEPPSESVENLVDVNINVRQAFKLIEDRINRGDREATGKLLELIEETFGITLDLNDLEQRRQRQNEILLQIKEFGAIKSKLNHYFKPDSPVAVKLPRDRLCKLKDDTKKAADAGDAEIKKGITVGASVDNIRRATEKLESIRTELQDIK